MLRNINYSVNYIVYANTFPNFITFSTYTYVYKQIYIYSILYMLMFSFEELIAEIHACKNLDGSLSELNEFLLTLPNIIYYIVLRNTLTTCVSFTQWVFTYNLPTHSCTCTSPALSKCTCKLTFLPV